MHPTEANLALYAGEELGFWARLRTAHHLGRCPECSRHVEEFREIRDWTRSEREAPPGVEWDRLALELKANIRLGVAAGRCVAPAPSEAPRFRWRTAAMALPVLLVVVVGWMMLSLSPPLLPLANPAAVAAGPVLRADPSGIEIQQDGQAFALVHPHAAEITYAVSGPGTVRTRYLDSETGYVTISHVYAE
jgi:anti-sigma factor RsiW